MNELNERYYENPVRRGFYPDPSVLRVGEDYYMVNSTFQYFPAITISHSSDLVHWKTIGHAITKNEYLDLSGIADSHGIWAPDISYSGGVYYIFAPLRLNNPPEGQQAPLRVQLVMKSEKPEGPYSKPVLLPVDAIDPSHFVDDDGTHYMIVPPGVNVVKLNGDCSKVLEGPVCVWNGTGKRAPEGPHIFRRGEYYYAVLAEGGTGYGHSITEARAKNLYGPYEPCPYNPVLTQRDPSAKLQRCGHGDLVETQNGDWWILYLCGRPSGGSFTTLGRETSLDPVEWTDDGWFLVNRGRGPSEKQLAPDLPETACPEAYFDDFNGGSLSPEWEFVRNPDETLCSLTQRPGSFRIVTGNYGLDSIRSVNTLLRREEEFQYTASLKLEFHPAAGEKAGLVCYYGLRNYIECFMTGDGAGNSVVLQENRSGAVTRLGETAFSGNTVYLRVRVRGQERRFYASEDNQSWNLVGSDPDCTFLSDEGVTQGKHHTGTLVGLFANNGGSGSRIPADFDWFRYRNE